MISRKLWLRENHWLLRYLFLYDFVSFLVPLYSKLYGESAAPNHQSLFPSLPLLFFSYSFWPALVLRLTPGDWSTLIASTFTHFPPSACFVTQPSGHPWNFGYYEKEPFSTFGVTSSCKTVSQWFLCFFSIAASDFSYCTMSIVFNQWQTHYANNLRQVSWGFHRW